MIRLISNFKSSYVFVAKTNFRKWLSNKTDVKYTLVPRKAAVRLQ